MKDIFDGYCGFYLLAIFKLQYHFPFTNCFHVSAYSMNYTLRQDLIIGEVVPGWVHASVGVGFHDNQVGVAIKSTANESLPYLFFC